MWADPGGLYYWTVVVLHARFLRAAPYGAGTIDRRAYLVDLDGRGDLPDLERVLAHQDGHGKWQLREVDDAYVDTLVLYRVGVEPKEPLIKACCRYQPEARNKQPSARYACEPPIG